MSAKRAAIALILLAGVAAYAYAARREGQGAFDAAAPEPAPTWWDGVTENMPDLPSLPSFDWWTLSNQAETETKVDNMNKIYDTAANLGAFLEAIARAEGTAGQPDPYRVCYGYAHVVQSLADHPAITGEWKGGKLSDSMCKAAGFGPGCVSTAAGKYQFTKPTWQRLKSKLKLADFGPASQDAACLELLRECGAYELAARGDVKEAALAARRTWASLPGAGYNQPERSLAWLQNQFTAAGGVLA
ncbi:MAG: glycoside hydrolase family 104 protein [Rhodoferax sp.]|nr:glycoside hydrolase family 104 protein [Rhodoferax sp.]